MISSVIQCRRTLKQLYRKCSNVDIIDRKCIGHSVIMNPNESLLRKSYVSQFRGSHDDMLSCRLAVCDTV